MSGFEELLDAHRARGAGTSGPDRASLTRSSLSLDDALVKYEALGGESDETDPLSERFRSTIEFPAFLLHVLKIWRQASDDESEGDLDDKQLIKLFTRTFDRSSGKEVREFTMLLLRCRNNFDAFVLRRQITAGADDDSDWSMQRLVKATSQGKQTTGYRNSLAASRSDSDENGVIDDSTRDLLLIESMLRVTYTGSSQLRV